MGRVPFANWALILVNVVVFAFQFSGAIDQATVLHIASDGWNPLSLLASCFLHGSVLHPFGNMLFLWTFGNPMCQALGWWRYLLVYCVLGIAAGLIFKLVVGHPGIGASGAINGIVGMYLVLFPINDVSCFWYAFFRYGVVEVSGFWLVLAWLGVDIYGAMYDSDGMTGYWAHIGGFAGGVGVGFLFDVNRWTLLKPEEQCSILALATGRHSGPSEPEKFRGRPREDLIRELPKAAKSCRPAAPQDDSPIPMD